MGREGRIWVSVLWHRASDVRGRILKLPVVKLEQLGVGWLLSSSLLVASRACLALTERVGVVQLARAEGLRSFIV